MATAFDRYNGLLGGGHVTYETVAACGRLITADAQLNGLLVHARFLGHVDGPVSRPEWVEFTRRARNALLGFDGAWSRYKTELTRDNVGEADVQLRSAVKIALQKIEELIELFPDRERLISW